MIIETTWYVWLINIGDADKISAAIVKEINDNTDQPLQLFLHYGLHPDTITQDEYENLCHKLAKLKK